MENLNAILGVMSFVGGGLGLYIKLTVDTKMNNLTNRVALIEQQQIQHKELLEELRSMRSDITALQVQVAVSTVKGT